MAISNVSKQLSVRRASALAVLLMLAACGGGGDGGTVSTASAPSATATSAGSTESPRTGATGFVPVAPGVGETLLADAATLRPLRDEAVWAYRGTKSGASGAVAYGSFRQLIAAGGAYEERISSPVEGASRVRVLRLAGGELQRRDDLGLGGGATTEMVTELRSPVRQNDQMILADVVGAPLKEDLDRDGKVDKMDLGSWSRVIGFEPVDLPELGRTLNALRVDVTATARVTLSSRTQPEPALTVLESTWYAPEVGIVRRTSTAPSGTGIGPVETDERLQYWDGIDKGLGLVPSMPVARSGGPAALGPWLELPFAAVRNGTRAFVLSSRGGVPARADRGVVLSVLDARGRVLHSVEHLDLALEPQARPELLPLADGVAMVFSEPGVYADPYLLENLRLQRFDAQGQPGTSHWLAYGALPGTLKAASDGQRVWVSWVEPGLVAGTTRVMVQAFDERGFELGLPQVLETRSGFEPATIGIAAAAGKALVTWRVPQLNGVDFRQALVSTASAPVIGTLEAGAVTLATGAQQPMPRLDTGLAAITWYEPLQTAGGLARLPRGVSLDAQGQPRRAVAGSADNETLPLPAHEGPFTSLQADGAQLLWAGAGAGRVRREDQVDDRFLDLARLDPASGPLSASAVRLQRYRDRSPGAGVDVAPTAVRHILSFDDRILVIGQESSRLTVAVLYR